MLKKVLVVVLLLFTGGNTQAAEQIKLGLLTLDKPNHPFWGNLESLMEAAARDLHISLERYYALSERSNMVLAMQQAHDDGVDALVFANYKESALDMLELSERLNLPVFLINVDISKRNKPVIGNPREKYSQWLGRMLPDEEQAGYLLGKALIEERIRVSPEVVDEGLEIVAITGTFHDTPSSLRVMGLKNAVADYDFAILNQVVYAQWSGTKAYQIANRLLQRYPDTEVFWTASDLMGLSVMNLIHEIEVEGSAQRVTGGVDWSIEGIQSLDDSHYVASIGGHILEGAWAAVLLFDYLNGVDFADQGVDYSSTMSTFDATNSARYLERIEKQDWDEIDFSRFSRFLNPALAEYVFTPDVLFQGTKQ